jgi:NADPH-ferrihemoprotein reductase
MESTAPVVVEAANSTALFDTSDLILLSAIGLGTAAWFSRRQLKELLFGNKKATTPVVVAPVKKRETNFVKVMAEQVKFWAGN